MKRAFLLLIFCLLFVISGCVSKVESKVETRVLTWQEQYDLGVRYLSEGNYEEAIIAFTTAIEIDSKQVPAYIGLVDAYIGVGDYIKAGEVIAQGQQVCGDDEAFNRILNNLSFLQTGDAGIRITSFYFNKEAFLAGEGTDFLVSVVYRCPESEDCILMIGANTEEPYSFAMMDNDFPVTGSGGYQFHVSVAPVQWEESYFGIYVNLSEANHAETWTPFAMDVLYITPEQDIVGNQAQTNNSSAGVELNAYSATEFEHRSNYYAFSDMALEEQQIIETIGNSAISNDISTLYSLLDSSKIDAFYNTECYTIWNGYKVGLLFRPYEVDDEGDSRGGIDITLRPENGMGYHCTVYSNSAISTLGRDYWNDYYYSEEWLTCLCVDWQWNGSLTLTAQTRSLWRSQDGYSNESVEDTTESGKMVNNLRDGTFTKNVHQIENWNHDDMDSDSTETFANTYQNGVLTSTNGEAKDGTFVGADIMGIGYGGDTNSQHYIDRLYW